MNLTRERHSTRLILCFLTAAGFLMTGCSRTVAPDTVHKMGEEVKAGSVVYTVMETEWRSELGEGLELKAPKHRFLVLRLSIHNAGTREVALPLLQLEGARDTSYMEVSELKGVANSLGLLRILEPGVTLRGIIVFDVPSAAYRLRISDGGGLEEERTALIEIPLNFGAPPVLDLQQPGAGLPGAQ